MQSVYKDVRSLMAKKGKVRELGMMYNMTVLTCMAKKAKRELGQTEKHGSLQYYGL